MTQLVGGVDYEQRRTSRNLNEIAAYLRDIREDPRTSVMDAELLTRVLQSIERDLSHSYPTESSKRSAA